MRIGMVTMRVRKLREPCETAIAFRDAQREMDRRLMAVVEQLSTADLDRVVNVHRGEAQLPGAFLGPPL
jgi:hypothetical protein